MAIPIRILLVNLSSPWKPGTTNSRNHKFWIPGQKRCSSISYSIQEVFACRLGSSLIVVLPDANSPIFLSLQHKNQVGEDAGKACKHTLPFTTVQTMLETRRKRMPVLFYSIKRHSEFHTRVLLKSHSSHCSL